MNPVLEFVDFRVQVIPYETKPLWRIKQESFKIVGISIENGLFSVCNCLILGASAIILPEQYDGHLAAAAIVQVLKLI